LLRAIVASTGGIPTIGTSAELMNVNGKIHVKLAAWTVSVSLSVSPIHADTHDDAVAATLANQLAEDTGDLPLMPDAMRADITRASQTPTNIRATDSFGAIRATFRHVVARYLLAYHGDRFKALSAQSEELGETGRAIIKRQERIARAQADRTVGRRSGFFPSAAKPNAAE
jgi:hypothetical protein